MPIAPRWGDEDDDSDDEKQPQQQHVQGDLKQLVIPPTHKSRVDTKGIQVVTSYRLNPSNHSQLLKTVTKVKVSVDRVREPKAVAERRQWSKFGQALVDEKENTKTTVQSKDEILLEDPKADTDLQDEDPGKAIAGNLNEFWAKQQRRQLERKYDVTGENNNNETQESGWTQVGSGAGAAPGTSTGKYVPPAARGGGVSNSGGTAFKPERRVDDLNTIRVTNLSENTTEQDLQELFEKYGRISRVYLAKDKETMQSRGFAFVSFVMQSDAAKAMDELQGYGYDHLILKLEWARPNAPKDPASSGTEFRSGYGKALAQDTTAKVSYASNLTK